MTFTHTDIEERLIDFLYGELDAEARAAFDVHITACDACRSEVRAFEQTRAAARAVVRAPLEHPVPAAVRARVMDAAARATAARGIVGHAPAPKVAGPRTRVAPRWFAWLRARWALPTFATVAAICALLLVRETIFREARRPLGEAPPADLVPKGAAPLSEPAPRTDRRAAAEEIQAAGGAKNLRVGRGRDRLVPPVQAPKKAAVADPKAIIKRRSQGFGYQGSADDFEADVSSAGSTARAPTARRMPSVPAAEPPASASPAAAATSASSESAPDPAAALVDRAEKLMVAQRWNDAVVAYRALIQRFPRNASAPTWRRRLAAAEAAAARDDQRFATPPPPR